MIAQAGEKFGCRPSALAGIDDPVMALDFDLAALVRLTKDEIAMTERALESEGVQLPAPRRPRQVEW